MLRDNLVELIEPMLNSAGADPLALYIHPRTPAGDDRLLCLKNPRPEGAESSLTESASSPFQAEPAQQRDHCNSGPPHHPTACTWRVLNRQRLYAAPVKVNSHPTFSSPRNFTFFSMPMTFIHPNDCSTRFRFCWLSS